MFLNNVLLASNLFSNLPRKYKNADTLNEITPSNDVITQHY